MAKDRYRVVDEALGRMNLEEKVGQLFTQAFYGSVITPDVVAMIRRLHCGGLRVTSFYRQFLHYARPGQERKSFDRTSPASVTPHEFNDVKDTYCKPPYLTIPQYARLLNRLKEIAADRPYHVPLHLALDQEGDMSFDFVRGGVRFFPAQWGIARAADPRHVYEVCRTTARQLAAVGFNTVHSPVLDVVRDPVTSYIGTRAFGSDVRTVSEMGVAAVRGYLDGGVMPCGKHFPGRGSTHVDDHHDVGAIELDRDELRRIDLAPYREAIAAGLPMIMVAHSIYPAYDPVDLASCSEPILRGLARGELGFRGIITTDSIIMGAVARKYGIPRACVLAIRAGANLVLMKETGPIRDESYRRVLEAVRSGEISEDHVDRLVETTLRTKVDQGLYGEGYLVDPDAAEQVIRSPESGTIEARAARKAVSILRNEAGLLPLSGDERVLLVEQIAPPHLRANDAWAHPGIFWEQFLEFTDRVGLLEILVDPADEDRLKARELVRHFDVVVMTHYTARDVRGAADLIGEILATGKPVVVVANSPLPKDTPQEWPTVLVTHGVMPPLLRVAARRIYGIDSPGERPSSRSSEQDRASS